MPRYRVLCHLRILHIVLHVSFSQPLLFRQIRYLANHFYVLDLLLDCATHRSPDKKPILQKLLHTAKSSSTSGDPFGILYASITDHFELCLTKCRTSSQSVQHENSYRDPKSKHCFSPGTGTSLSPPSLAATTPSSSGLSIINHNSHNNEQHSPNHETQSSGSKGTPSPETASAKPSHEVELHKNDEAGNHDNPMIGKAGIESAAKT